MTRSMRPELKKGVFCLNRVAHDFPSSFRINQDAPHGGELDYTPILSVRFIFFFFLMILSIYN